MADTLEVEQSARLKLLRNDVTLYEQQFSSTAATYSVHAADRVVLATNMSAFEEASIGSVNTTNTGSHLMVVSSQAIDIAVNTTAQSVNADVFAMSGATITHLYFKNTDTDNEATVEFVVSDES